MAGLRPFRGLRYTEAAGPLGSLLSAASGTLTPQRREDYALRSPYNAVTLAAPAGQPDDRSKYIRFARGAAQMADWRRQALLAPETRPAYYRLTQNFGKDGSHVSLIAVADLSATISVETPDPKFKEERLRLIEATRATFEPALAYYEDPAGAALDLIRSLPASSEVDAVLDGVASRLETIDDPAAVEALTAAFSGKTFYAAENVEGVEAARAFRESLGEKDGAVSEDGTLLVLTSLEDPSFTLLAVHPVIRRFPGGLDRDAVLARLSTRFTVEEHQNRNLEIHLNQANEAGKTVFAMATEGGFGYLLTPKDPPDVPASIWFQREVFSGLFGISPNDPTLYFTDPIQAFRAADEGAAAAFLLSRPHRSEIPEAHRLGLTLPHRSSYKFPWVPTGLVMWAMGDEA